MKNLLVSNYCSIKNIVNIFNICRILLIQYIYYFWHNNRLYMIQNISKQIVNINIIYIKIFQIICMNNNLLYDNEHKYLLKYTDSVEYKDDEIDKNSIELLKNNEDIIIDDNPVNCGCIAIVYRGKYKNIDVAIKILKIDIEKKIINAIADMEFIFNIMDYIPFLNLLKLKKMLEYNTDILLDQANFDNEKKNITMFRDKYKNSKWVKIPELYNDINLPNVIIMEYIDGYKITQLTDSRDKIEVSKMISKFTISGLLFHNIIHLDIHVGNLFYIKNVDNSCQLGVIDFGMIALPSRENQNFYYNFMKNIFISKDCNSAVDLIFEYNICEPQDIFKTMSNKNIENLKNDLLNITQNCIETNNVSIQYVYRLISILNKYKIFLNRELIKVMITSGISMELIKSIDPEWQTNLLEFLENISNIYKMIEI